MGISTVFQIPGPAGDFGLNPRNR